MVSERHSSRTKAAEMTFQRYVVKSERLEGETNSDVYDMMSMEESLQE